MANETKIVITAATAQAEGALRSLSGATEGLARKMTSLSGITAAFTGALSVTAFAAMIKGSIDLADSLNDLSKRTGASVETLAGFRLAAMQSGTSLEAIANGTKKLATSITENEAVFKKYGITTTSQTEALIQLGDVFAGIEDPVQRSALAVKLFGKAGDELIPLLMEGSEGMRRMIERGKELSGITAEMAENADKFNDSMAEMKLVSGALGMSIANDLLPHLNEITRAMMEAKRESGLLKAVWVGLGGLGTALFTDDMLSRADQLRKQIAEINTGMTGEAATPALEARRRALEQELERVTQLAAAEKERAAFQKELEKFKRSEGGVGWRMLNDLSGKGKEKSGNAGKSDYDRLTDDFNKRRAMLSAEADSETRLTETQKYAIDIMQQMANGKLKLTTAQEQEEGRRLGEILLLDQENEARKQLQAATEAQADVLRQLSGEFDRNLDAQRRAMDIMPESQRKLGEELDRVSQSEERARHAAVRMYVDGKLNAEQYLSTQDQITAESERQRDAVKNLSEEQARLNASWEYGAVKAMRVYMDEITNVAKQSEQAFTSVFKGMEDGLTRFFETGKFGIKEFANVVRHEMASLAAKQTMSALMGSGSGNGGIFGSILGSFLGSWSGGGASPSSGPYSLSTAASSFGLKMRASGGPVDAFTPYLVGERGPEIMVPHASGTIVPNDRIGARSAAPVIHMTINTPDANSFRASEGQITAQAARMIQRARRNM